MAARKKTAKTPAKKATRKSTKKSSSSRRVEAQIGLDAIAIEGGLLSPSWLSRIAQAGAPSQTEADYAVPKGLTLRDEIGRYWRVGQAHWAEFVQGRAGEADPDALARRLVLGLLRQCFGFGSIDAVEPRVLDERTYPIGHAALAGRVPIVIAPAGIGLDTPDLVFGEDKRRRSPFGLAQEYLNADDAALWGLVCDGVTLRVVRDNASLTRPAWIEVDLARIFAEDLYAEFAALWLLIHETRFGRSGTPATECALEAWRNAGLEEGTRARDYLRSGVEDALLALGQGFLAHPENRALRIAIQEGALTTREYFNQLLRLVYRVIFLLTTEERGLLHAGSDEQAKALYAQGYSLKRLRDRAVRRSAHDRFSDVWESVKIVFRSLVAGEPRLGLPALAGLFAAKQCQDLDAAKLENHVLMHAMFKLSWLRQDGALARVNWRDMGPEELGSVYESLLELLPRISKDGREFGWAQSAESKGNARKTSGSYYTPDSLVQLLLDNALEPVITDTLARNPERPVEALLELSIVDPACGSGHFLLGAARRLAGHVARLQANGTPSPEDYRHAVRQVVGRCIYGVDLNPMAVELCKVSLWMEAVDPGMPLTFLDSHIQQGNSLLGTTPELMAKGIPDIAFDPLHGDDRKIASSLKKHNKQTATGQRSLDSLWEHAALDGDASLRDAVVKLEATTDTDHVSLTLKESSWNKIITSKEYEYRSLVANMWCAAFVWPKYSAIDAENAPTNDLWRQIRDGKGNLPLSTSQTIHSLNAEYRFFHWHLRFPHVTARGGFDLVLGNPPWEELTPSAKEFFSAYDASIRNQDKAGETAITTELLKDSSVADAWNKHCRQRYGQIHLLKNSGRHILFAPGNLGKGDFNIYRMFVETAMNIVRGGGMAAQIVPETLYSGATTMAIRGKLLEHFDWKMLAGFENTNEVWFPGVDSRAKFCLYVARRGGQTSQLRISFGIRSPDRLPSLSGSNGDHLYISPETIRVFSPEALSIMEIASLEDFGIARKMHAKSPTLGAQQSVRPLHKHMREVDMTNDSSIFRDVPPGLPVYEGRMVGIFDHRAKGYRGGKARSANWAELPFGDDQKEIHPQFYIRADDLPAKLGQRPFRYRAGFCNIASPTNERALVSALIPAGTVCGNKVPTIDFEEGYEWYAVFWVALANSFAMDFIARKKVSLTMTNTIVDSLPMPKLPLGNFLVQTVVPIATRLSCVGDEMEGYWSLLTSGGQFPRLTSHSSRFASEEERFFAMAELNALIAFHLFELERDELSYIMDTFPIVRKKDEKSFGEYRTKRVILEIYDEMAKAARTGEPYQTRLDPPPADLRAAPSDGNVVLFPARPSQQPLPKWDDDQIFEEVAARVQLTLGPETWATRLSGQHLGMVALAAVLRNQPGPRAREDVERAVVLTMLPRLMRPYFKSASARQKWATIIGTDDLNRSSVSDFEIPWSTVLRRAVQEQVLLMSDGLWQAGVNSADAPSSELDARALVVLAWLATAPAKDNEVTTQIRILDVG